MYIKSQQETKIIAENGKILGEILFLLEEMVEPGISAFAIDQKAQTLIKKAGAIPTFLGYKTSRYDPPFPGAICASINEEVVHGIPTKEKVLHEGDIFSIDIGLTKNNLIVDTALTVSVGNISHEATRLVDVTYAALKIGIAQCVAGNTVADIGKAIQSFVESQGVFGIVRDLVGHGVGHELHEDPRVPNYYDSSLKNWRLESGVVLALEPMITLGDYRVKTADDGWSISTKDNSLAAHFEHTIIITDAEPIVATKRHNETL